MGPEVRKAMQTLALEATLAVRAIELREELHRRASRDALTDLANRAGLHEQLAHVLANRRNVHGPTALVVIDLDGCKAINDRHGHETGDKVLVEVARLLKACVRDGDSVARLGGDEFAILAEGLTDRQTACHVAERIIAAIQQPVTVGRESLPVGPSIGIAFLHDCHDAAELLREADLAMYSAKAAGKGRYHVYADGADRLARTP
jgi:diguanylate cyclase (GGDEF)-like protein